MWFEGNEKKKHRMTQLFAMNKWLEGSVPLRVTGKSWGGGIGGVVGINQLYVLGHGLCEMALRYFTPK